MAAAPTTQSAPEDFMRLQVSEEEAEEFNFDLPSAVAAPTDARTPRTKTVSSPSDDAQNEAAMHEDPPQMSSSLNGSDVDMTDDLEFAPVGDSPPGNMDAGSATPSPLSTLYRSLVMDLEASPVLVAKYRLDTLHIRGVDEMSTDDVLKYFAPYKPKKVEWVNDTSCNVVFPDELLAGNALIALSSPLKVTKRPLPTQGGIPGIQQPVYDAETGEAVFVSDVVSFPIPVPHGTWRVAKVHPPNTKQLIFRYARTIDKKPQNAQKFSQYYSKYGNPNMSGLPNQELESRRVRNWQRKVSSGSMEDREPLGLCVTGEVLEVEQPSRMRRQQGLYADRRDVSPYSRPRADDRGDGESTSYGEDLRSLLEVRGAPMEHDLRYRIRHTDSQPVVVRSSSDLRNRLNQQRGSQ